MMTGQINFSLYLTEEEQREIARDEFRAQIRNCLATKNDVERFVGNVAHVAIWEVVDEALGAEGASARAIIGEKAATLIRNLSSYSVFREGDSVLNPKPSVGQQFLEEAVRENKDLIAKRVRRIINEVGADDLQDAITAVVADAFRHLATEPKP